MSQPRGGPLLAGHASHQVDLDADIWLTPMPDRELTREEREEMMATMVVAADRKDVDKSPGRSAGMTAEGMLKTCPGDSGGGIVAYRGQAFGAKGVLLRGGG